MPRRPVPKEEVDNVASLHNYFEGIIKQARKENYVDFLKEVARTLERIHQHRFQRRQSPSGEDWIPWFFRPTWADPDHETLEITGNLRGSLTEGHSEHVRDIDTNGAGFSFLTWGTSVPYAWVHNFGGSVIVEEALVSRDGKRVMPDGSEINIPKREFVGITEPIVGKIVKTASDTAVESFKKE